MSGRAAPKSRSPAPGAIPLTSVEPIKPALATLASTVPAGEEWFGEIKFDGYRMLVDGREGRVAIFSRNGIPWTAKLPELTKDLAWLAGRGAILDGELVAFRPDGITSFELLKEALSEKRTGTLVYMAFDLLALDGWDLRPCRQDDRSRLLQGLLAGHLSDRVRPSEVQDGAPAAFHRAACEHGLEGIILKRRDARYRAGRTDSWLKVKCGGRQELAVIGYTDPEGSRSGFGALLLGYRQDDAWVYAGRVGTGFSMKFLTVFRRKLAAIEQQTPTAPLPKGHTLKGVHWVVPKYVGEIRFTEWTKDGILRHPSFLGLREDKRAEEVVREVPVAV
ncbi:MAG: ligD1 [Rhodospirillales bacterium]|nr:ligD1 [Rhodospirillales bacterium]